MSTWVLRAGEERGREPLRSRQALTSIVRGLPGGGDGQEERGMVRLSWSHQKSNPQHPTFSGFTGTGLSMGLKPMCSKARVSNPRSQHCLRMVRDLEDPKDPPSPKVPESP